MQIGLVMSFNPGFEQKLAWCKEHGIHSCQLGVAPSLLTEESAVKITELCEKYKMTISALVGAWTGPKVWNFIDGPDTLGIVPTAYRMQRMEQLREAAVFAKRLGVPAVNTHMGFIPENPSSQGYRDFISAARWLAAAYEEQGIDLLFETGQETPITMHRAITDIGSERIGVNFDPANLLLYGKANPLDALDIIGRHVRGVHAKDGEYPTDGHALGQEKPLGQGRVNFPAFIGKLKELGYDGPITIEREITGDKQKEDVLTAKAILEKLI